MSQLSTPLKTRHQFIKARNNFDWVLKDGKYPAVFVSFTGLKGIKKTIYSSFVVFFLSTTQVRAQISEVLAGYSGHVPLAGEAIITKGVKRNEQGVSYGFELLSLVSPFGKPVSEQDPQTERAYSPKKGDERRIGVEQNNKLTPDDIHKFWRFLLTQLSAFAVALPFGMYLSMRSNLRREWRNNKPEGSPLKVPVLAMASILCITCRIKTRRWLIWEQRHWFRDMNVCNGFERAYRDARAWKRSFT